MSTVAPVAYSHFQSQVRSRDRVRDLAEVYTHEREVNAMLDLVSDMFPSTDNPENIDRTFMEPACGHGNFLVEIIRRKLEVVKTELYGMGTGFEYRLIRCFTSTYGIDIDENNIAEARWRMLEELDRHLRNQGISANQQLLEVIETVLGTNIQQADTLAQAREIELVEYVPVGEGRFLREWSRLESDLDAQQPDLFTLEPELKQDAKPVHYTELVAQTTAVAIG